MNNLPKFIITCILSFIVLSSSSQIINIDKIDTSAYTKKAIWDGNVALGLEVDKQKETLYDVTNFLNASLQKFHELFILSCSQRLTYNGPQDFLNTGYFHLRWRHNYKNQLHPETYVQYQWDTKIGLKQRIVTGANLRYNFWHKKEWELTFATGLMYENEIWDYDAVDSSKIPVNKTDVKTSLIKSNNYIKWEGKPSQSSTITVAVFYQAKFDDFLNPRITSIINFDVDISKHFSFGLKFNGTYDAKPVVPIENFYYSLSYNIIYKL